MICYIFYILVEQPARSDKCGFEEKICVLTLVAGINNFYVVN